MMPCPQLAVVATLVAVAACLVSSVTVLFPQHPPGITGRVVGVRAATAHSVRERHRLPPRSDDAEIDDATPTYDVVVVGGGVAGLTAAWHLAEAGPPTLRCVVLEMEEAPGGNSRGGHDPASGLRYPWGAHYLPVPSGTGATAQVTKLLETVLHDSPRPDECDEQPWCRGQLFMPETGRWEGLPERGGMLPTAELDAEGWRQYHRFMSVVDKLASAVGADGRPAFAVPVDASSADPTFRNMDEVAMSEWMERQGFTSEPLLWFVDYGCRDDYGTTLETTSAWAALHYFCSRETENALVWPDGLGAIVDAMVTQLRSGGRTGQNQSRRRPAVEIRTSSMVHRITQQPSLRRATIEYADFAVNASQVLQARHVIFAAPHHTARHIVSGYASKEIEDSAIECGAAGCLNFSYAPWCVANVFLREPPPLPWAWENMVYDPVSIRPPSWNALDPGQRNAVGVGALGYVIAPSEIREWSSWQVQWPYTWIATPLSWLTGITPIQAHARIRSIFCRVPFSATLTAYFMLPLSTDRSAFPPSHWLDMEWHEWRTEILDSLSVSIPHISQLAYRLDIRVLGHAMSRPTPGFLWGSRSPRKFARRRYGVVSFAHSDNSGFSIFEEAVSQGLRAANEVLGIIAEDP